MSPNRTGPIRTWLQEHLGLTFTFGTVFGFVLATIAQLFIGDLYEDFKVDYFSDPISVSGPALYHGDVVVPLNPAELAGRQVPQSLEWSLSNGGSAGAPLKLDIYIHSAYPLLLQSIDLYVISCTAMTDQWTGIINPNKGGGTVPRRDVQYEVDQPGSGIPLLIMGNEWDFPLQVSPGQGERFRLYVKPSAEPKMCQLGFEITYTDRKGKSKQSRLHDYEKGNPFRVADAQLAPNRMHWAEGTGDYLTPVNCTLGVCD